MKEFQNIFFYGKEFKTTIKAVSTAEILWKGESVGVHVGLTYLEIFY